MSQNRLSWCRVVVSVAALTIVAGVLNARAEDVEKPWDSSVALGISAATGNKDVVLFTGAIKGDKLWKTDELHLVVEGAYGKSDGDVSTESLHGAAKQNHLFTERFYSLALADGLHDGVADLAYRLTLSPGVGYYVIKSERTRLAGEFGGAYIQEKYNSEDLRQFFTLRIADRYDFKISEGAKLWQQTEYLPRVDDFSKYLLNSEVGIESALTKKMSLRLVGIWRYNSDPPTDNRRYDLAMVSALAYKF